MMTPRAALAIAVTVRGRGTDESPWATARSFRLGCSPVNAQRTRARYSGANRGPIRAGDPSSPLSPEGRGEKSRRRHNPDSTLAPLAADSPQRHKDEGVLVEFDIRCSTGFQPVRKAAQ